MVREHQVGAVRDAACRGGLADGLRGAVPWSANCVSLMPRSGYAAGKVPEEHYASAWARQADGVVVALRCHNVYGPVMPRDTPYSGVASIFRSSLERGEASSVFEDRAAHTTWHSGAHERSHRGRRRHRRHGFLPVPRRPADPRRADAVRRPVGPGRGRHRRRAPRGVLAPPRPRPRVPAAPHQLPRQPLGAAVASGSVRCSRRARSAACAPTSRPATSSSRTSSSTGPAAGPTRSSSAARCTCRSRIRTVRG